MKRVLAGVVFLACGLALSLMAGVAQAATVPDVVGSHIADAFQTLEDAGFAARGQIEINTILPGGTVVSQDPAAGSEADLGSTVMCVFTYNPPPPLPLVVGKTLAEATQILEDAGFVVGNVVHGPSLRPIGVVFKQDPYPYYPQPQGTAIDLWVSTGVAPDMQCDEKFGDVRGYKLCDEAAYSCRFSTYARGETCADICASENTQCTLATNPNRRYRCEDESLSSCDAVIQRRKICLCQDYTQ